MYNAQEIIQRHQDAINERDLAKYIDTTVFPFTYQNYNRTAVSFLILGSLTENI